MEYDEALIIAAITIITVPITTILTHWTNKKLLWKNMKWCDKEDKIIVGVYSLKTALEPIDQQMELMHLAAAFIKNYKEDMKLIDCVPINTKKYMCDKITLRTRILKSESKSIRISDAKLEFTIHTDGQEIKFFEVKKIKIKKPPHKIETKEKTS